VAETPKTTRQAFMRRAAEILAKAPPRDDLIVTIIDSGAPRELVAPEDCDHTAGWCIDDDPESSGCSGCGMTRDRATCGEVDDQTEALDRLDIAIRDHPMAGSARQWRLIAADLVRELTSIWGPSDDDFDEILARVRAQHDERTIIPRGD
jgi:hypothetical protein